MPQLDKATWLFIIVLSMTTLFIVFQLKISSQVFPAFPSLKILAALKTKHPWESKWMKIYLPLSLPLQ